MTKDFAKPSTTRTPKKTVPKKKTWKAALALCLVLVMFTGSLFYLSRIPETKPADNSPAPAAAKQNNDKQQNNTVSKTEEPTPRFTFYDDLPQRVVEPIHTDSYQFKEKGKEKPYVYIIQTGSFRKIEDADRQRATLALQGLKSQIETVTNAENSVWHRVKLGPYQSRSTMNRDMDKVVALNIQPLVKKVPKPE